MAFDAAQILRQTYAAGAEAMQMRELAQTEKTEAPVSRGEINGTSFVVEADPMAELMDSMEELSFQFEEKEMKHVGERQMGQMQGARSALIRAVETWLAMMPDMPDAGEAAAPSAPTFGLARAISSFTISSVMRPPSESVAILTTIAFRSRKFPGQRFAGSSAKPRKSSRASLLNEMCLPDFSENRFSS